MKDIRLESFSFSAPEPLIHNGIFYNLRWGVKSFRGDEGQLSIKILSS
jgi:hypothetical protein